MTAVLTELGRVTYAGEAPSEGGGHSSPDEEPGR